MSRAGISSRDTLKNKHKIAHALEQLQFLNRDLYTLQV